MNWKSSFVRSALLLLAGAVIMCSFQTMPAGAMTAGVVDKPDTDAKNDFYAGNREPLLPSPFIKLPVGAIEPQGWVRKQLELEADGFNRTLYYFPVCLAA